MCRLDVHGGRDPGGQGGGDVVEVHGRGVGHEGLQGGGDLFG